MHTTLNAEVQSAGTTFDSSRLDCCDGQFTDILQDAVVTAWGTKRKNQLKTVGIVVSSDGLTTTDREFAAWIGNRIHPSFASTPAAFGKVVLINSNEASVGVFQLKDHRAELVLCGNGSIAGGAAHAMHLNQRMCSMTVRHSSSPISATASIGKMGNDYTVRATWCLQANTIEVQGAYTEATGWATVRGINDYTIHLVNSLPTIVPSARHCREKICFVEANGHVPRIRVATCGRWHGALPLTGAIALAIARQALPFVAAAIPAGVVAHPSDVEELPVCLWDQGILRVEMPETQVEFAAPIFSL